MPKRTDLTNQLGMIGSPLAQIRMEATGQDSRVLFLIVHFTAEDLETSLRYLTQGPVSSHYVVSDESPPQIYQLVDESQRAWHAGLSRWGEHAGINASSIGIEIVNRGPTRMADGTMVYATYPSAQIDAVIALAKDIVARHGIRPQFVLGHSDIAPQRKDDPGPMFPWKRLAEAGLIVWPDEARVAAARTRFAQQLPSVEWFQDRLAKHGFAVSRFGFFDDATRRVIAAFQMKYRSTRYDGEPDAETAALLQVLTESMQ